MSFKVGVCKVGLYLRVPLCKLKTFRRARGDSQRHSRRVAVAIRVIYGEPGRATKIFAKEHAKENMKGHSRASVSSVNSTNEMRLCRQVCTVREKNANEE